MMAGAPLKNPQSVLSRRPRRWLRWAFWTCLSCLLLLGIGIFILTRPSVYTSLVASALSDRLGAHVEIQEGSWESGGRFKFTGITVRAADMEGLPGEIASIESLILTINPGGILGNEAIVQDVEVGPGVLRVAEHVVDGADINIDHLFRNRPGGEGGVSQLSGGVLPALPRKITMQSMLLETGRFSGDAFFLKGGMLFSGSAIPDPEAGHMYLLELKGSSEQTGVVAISGTFDPNIPSLSATMSEGELSESILDFLPSTLSKEVEDMNLEGLISDVQIDWKGGSVPRVQVELRDVSLTLPPDLGLGDFWARYSNEDYWTSPDPPRMLVSKGAILLDGTTLEFNNLQGTFTSQSEEKLAEIPFSLDMTLTDLPLKPLLEGEGFDRGSKPFPFTLELVTEDFTLGEGVDQADMPVIVAQILAIFRVQTCTVNTKIKVERGPPAGGNAGSLSYEGSLEIRQASGAYSGFPYPLVRLDADVDFNKTTVFVKNLDAAGAGNSRIQIQGKVDLHDADGPEVDIQLVAANLPLDMTLVNSLPEQSAEALRSLFRNYGVSSKASAVDEVGESLEHEHVDLKLDILRRPGPGMPTRLQGQITFDSLDLSWDSFPYPVTLGPGRLRWFEDELHLEGGDIGEGVEFRTEAGGVGEVTGTIQVPAEEDLPASGQLNLAIRQQPVTPAFIEALNVPAPAAAELIEALRLEGMLSISGPIDVAPSGETAWDLGIVMEGGTVEPRDQLARILGMGEAFWERDMRLDALDVSLRCTTDRVEVENISGVGAEMQVKMHGQIAIANSASTDFQVDVSNAPIQDRLLRLASDTMQRTMEKLWDRWSPEGRVSLGATIKGEGDGIETVVTIRSMAMDLGLPQGEEHLSMEGGEIQISKDSISLDQVVVAAMQGDVGDGRYELEGTVEWDEEGTRTEVTKCSLDEGRFESPLLKAMLEEFVGGEVTATWDEIEPAGRFSAQARLRLEPESDWVWGLDVEPFQLAATYKGRRLESSFNHGLLNIENGFMTLRNLGGTCNAGTYVVSGTIDPTSGVSGELIFNFDGHINSPEIVTLMPEVASSIMNSIKFDDGEGTSIRGGELVLDIQPSVDYTGVDLDVELVLANASLEAGTTFKDIDGSATITLKSITGQPVQFNLDSKLDGVIIHGHALEDAILEMHLIEGDRLRLSHLSGNYAGGELYAQSTFDLGEAQTWDLELQVADASLVEFMPVPSASTEAEDEERKPASGRLYASAYMHGSLEDDNDRIGHGQVRIYEGDLQPLPVAVGIYQLLQMNPLIVVDSPNYVNVSWHMHGEYISLDEIILESAYEDYVTFSLAGQGEYDWNKQSIDARLRPRTGTPLLGDVLGALQDRFYAIGVDGPLEDPDVWIIPFPDIQ